MNKANSMHLRDVAMNAIGKWINADVRADYKKYNSGKHVAFFEVGGKLFRLTVEEIK